MNENEGIDPLGLGLDLSQVDTSRPCLPEGLYVLEVGAVELKANKAETGRNLVVQFKTVTDAMDHTGAKLIPVGFAVTKYYPMQQSDNPKAPDFKRDLAFLQDAVEGTQLLAILAGRSSCWRGRPIVQLPHLMEQYWDAPQVQLDGQQFGGEPHGETFLRCD